VRTGTVNTEILRTHARVCLKLFLWNLDFETNKHSRRPSSYHRSDANKRAVVLKADKRKGKQIESLHRFFQQVLARWVSNNLSGRLSRHRAQQCRLHMQWCVDSICCVYREVVFAWMTLLLCRRICAEFFLLQFSLFRPKEEKRETLRKCSLWYSF
jgi:hypothetical protein